MAQTTCPVCQSQQPDTSTLCEQCGWDFPIYLGSLEDAQKLATRRLKEARAGWQDQQERQQLRQSVQELLKKLALFEKNYTQLQNQVVGGLQQQITSLEQELNQAKSLNRQQEQQLAYAEQTRSQLQHRISSLEQDLKTAQHIFLKPRSYTKIGHNGVELPDDATQEQGWIMTRDNRTGLIWDIKNSGDEYHWYDAQMVFIKKLNTERFGGFSDWRLPTIEELDSIIDRIKSADARPYWKPAFHLVNGEKLPFVNTEYFPNTNNDYWSENSPIDRIGDAYAISTTRAEIYLSGKTEKKYVHAVRTAP